MTDFQRLNQNQTNEGPVDRLLVIGRERAQGFFQTLPNLQKFAAEQAFPLIEPLLSERIRLWASNTFHPQIVSETADGPQERFVGVVREMATMLIGGMSPEKKEIAENLYELIGPTFEKDIRSLSDEQVREFIVYMKSATDRMVTVIEEGFVPEDQDNGSTS